MMGWVGRWVKCGGCQKLGVGCFWIKDVTKGSTSKPPTHIHTNAHHPLSQVGGPQHIDYRLLAATRALVAKYQSEAEGRTLKQLGELDKPLNRQNEVIGGRWRGLIECVGFG